MNDAIGRTDLERRLVPRDALPLLGKHVLLTTPRNYAGLFSKPLIERGARVVLMPTIEIWPVEDYWELDRAIDDRSGYEWIIFSSQNGIEAFLNRLGAKGLDIEALSGLKLATLKADAAPAEKKGVKFDLIPPRSTLDGMIEEFKSRGVNHGRALVPLPEYIGMAEPAVISDFVEKLERLGFTVHRVPVYRTCLVTDLESSAIERRLLLNSEIDIVLFTSNGEIYNLVSILGDDWLVLNRTTVACLSYAEEKSAAELGVKVGIVVEGTSPAGLVEATVTALENYLRIKEGKGK